MQSTASAIASENGAHVKVQDTQTLAIHPLNRLTGVSDLHRGFEVESCSLFGDTMASLSLCSDALRISRKQQRNTRVDDRKFPTRVILLIVSIVIQLKTCHIAPVSGFGIRKTSTSTKTSRSIVRGYHHSERHLHARLALAATFNNSEYDNSSSLLSMVERAAVPLVWEQLQQRNQQPVLDLTALRKLQYGDDVASTPTPMPTTDTSAENTTCLGWEQGQVWTITRQGLFERGIFPSNDDIKDDWSFLEQCPQLYRLPSELVLETTDYLLESFNETLSIDTTGKNLILGHQKLLSYRKSDIEYGLTFLQQMMMLPSKQAAMVTCVNAPALFIAAIDGGIQERAVQDALQSASQATHQANQQVVANAMTSLQTIQNLKGKGG